MQADHWPTYCRALLAASVASAASRFPGRGEEAPERVHGVRKTLKESRALARLFLPTVGEPARVTIAALAVVRRRVGRARDLDVMESRLERLDPPREIAEPLGQAIAREREAAKRAHTHFATAASRAQLNAIVKRLEGWDLGHVGDGDIAEAVARTYRQGLRRGRLAFGGEDAAALHALRSRVVDLRYQLSALAPAWPAALGAQSEELNALRDTLGDFNDLAVGGGGGG
ncbi:CHAD domain-containing protein, partial [Roseiarcus sp.]|uniref:CHAD domain-containing protein n=1 Tax=Roseiarcus sp. TaxID=1969460 RepID=UPI003F98228D